MILRTVSIHKKKPLRPADGRTARTAQTGAAAKDKTPTARDRVLGTAILIVGFALFLWLTVLLCRPIVQLAADPGKLESFVREQGAMGRVSFLGIQILQGFVPIPLEVTAVAGGYVFGRLQGLILTLCAVMISTTAIFYFTRIFGHKLLNLFFSPAQQRKVMYFRNEKTRTALTWILFLIPGTPKRLFIFSAGLFPQRFGKFLLISTLARVPALLACAFGGQALWSGDYNQAFVIFSVVGVLGVAGTAAYKIFTK